MGKRKTEGDVRRLTLTFRLRNDREARAWAFIEPFLDGNEAASYARNVLVLALVGPIGAPIDTIRAYTAKEPTATSGVPQEVLQEDKHIDLPSTKTSVIDPLVDRLAQQAAQNPKKPTATKTPWSAQPHPVPKPGASKPATPKHKNDFEDVP